MALTHYIVVRRDLAFGPLLAMVAHAAGESFYALACPRSSVSERSDLTERSDVQLIPGAPSFNPAETVAVVMGAKNENRLIRLDLALAASDIPYVCIRETEGAHAGQLMAIGLAPIDKARVATYVKDFQMLRFDAWLESLPEAPPASAGSVAREGSLSC